MLTTIYIYISNGRNAFVQQMFTDVFMPLFILNIFYSLLLKLVRAHEHVYIVTYHVIMRNNFGDDTKILSSPE